MINLHSLLEKLEKCEGPDREIDAHIWAWSDGRKVLTDEKDRTRTLARSIKPPNDICLLGTLYDDQFIAHPAEVLEYTASLDAAVALVEKMLPGRDILIVKVWGKGGYAAIKKIAQPDVADIYGKTSTLALLTALIKALIAEEEK